MPCFRPVNTVHFSDIIETGIRRQILAKKVLVAYSTNAGSTAEVAQKIAETFGKDSIDADVRKIDEISDIEGYDAVVVGAPMILGLHKKAVRFLKMHQQSLGKIPVALFMTALKLTETGEDDIDGIPLYRDPALLAQPKNPLKLSRIEKHTTPRGYLRPILKNISSVKPVHMGFFKGKLDLRNLKLIQMLFVMLIIGAKPGDFRDWQGIQHWAAEARIKLIPNKG